MTAFLHVLVYLVLLTFNPQTSHPLPNPKSTVTTPTKRAGWPTLNDLAQIVLPSGTIPYEALRMGKYRV